jgi:hypothetical protein
LRLLTWAQLTIGVVWTVALVWVFLAISAIATPVSSLALIEYWGPLFLGPSLLVSASIALLFRTTHQRASAFTSALGSLFLAVCALIWVGPALLESVRTADHFVGFLLLPFVGSALLSPLIALRLNRSVWLRETPTHHG